MQHSWYIYVCICMYLLNIHVQVSYADIHVCRYVISIRPFLYIPYVCTAYKVTFLKYNSPWKFSSRMEENLHWAHCREKAPSQKELNNVTFVFSSPTLRFPVIKFVVFIFQKKKMLCYNMVTPHKKQYANRRWIFVMHNIMAVLLAESLITELISISPHHKDQTLSSI